MPTLSSVPVVLDLGGSWEGSPLDNWRGLVLVLTLSLSGISPRSLNSWALGPALGTSSVVGNMPVLDLHACCYCSLEDSLRWTCWLRRIGATAVHGSVMPRSPLLGQSGFRTYYTGCTGPVGLRAPIVWLSLVNVSGFEGTFSRRPHRWLHPR